MVRHGARPLAAEQKVIPRWTRVRPGHYLSGEHTIRRVYGDAWVWSHRGRVLARAETLRRLKHLAYAYAQTPSGGGFDTSPPEYREKSWQRRNGTRAAAT